MFWRTNSAQPPPNPESCAHALFEFLIASLRDKEGRVRVEDVISAAATIVGERCIEAAGNFKAREHTMAPGTRVFSDKVNELLCGDMSAETLTTIPADTIFGTLRDRLTPGKYTLNDFPSLKSIFQHFAANVGNKDDWGKAPLSVPPEHHPFVLPLRVAFSTRKKVDLIFESLGPSPAPKLHAAVLTLAEALQAVAEAIDHRTALLLAFETVNGMAKTAPMTDAAMAETQKSGPAK